MLQQTTAYRVDIGRFPARDTEQWIASNPFERLSVFDPLDDSDRRDPFTAAQPQTLFPSEPWSVPLAPNDKNPGAYWPPLLCLFHGLRNGEAAGLLAEDIGEEGGIPVLHVRAYGEKRLKTKEARGTLPIHPEIIRFGFLAHVARRRAAQEELLFPEDIVNKRRQVGAKLGDVSASM